MKRFPVPVLAAALLAAASAASAAPAATEPAPPADDPYEGFLALARCILIARERFVETNSFEELAQTAIDGFFAALDPYSRYLVSDEMDAIDRDDRGELVGIGVTVSEEDGELVVSWPLPGSPAFRAGVRMGDVVERIDGKRCADLGFDGSMDAIEGPEGSWVELDLLHADGVRERVRVRRSSVRVPTVQSPQVLTNGVGYVCLTQFGEGTAAELLLALSRLRREAAPLRGLVLDLRENPGGILDQAVRVAGLFLPGDTLIATTRGRVPDDNREFRSAGSGPFRDVPLAVLVNENSASAAEFVAAALRDAGRARLVGAHTFGKASVQSFFSLPERPKDTVKITTAHYYTPRGELIHGKGLEPDVPVPQTGDELWDATLRRIAATHPELACTNSLPEILSAPDRPLEAALSLLAGAEEDGRAEDAPEGPSAEESEDAAGDDAA